jgi:hypothetical protein
MKRACALILPFLAACASFAQTGAIQGHSFLGGRQAVTQGASSNNYLNGIVPTATITVYLTGTETLATLYSDSGGTPLANPFTSNAVNASNPGGWIFFAATQQGYDIVASGGIPPNTYASPVTLCKDCFPSSQFIVDIGVKEIVPGTNVTCSPLLAGSCTGDVTVNGATANDILTAFYTPPAAGQYVVLYPTSAPAAVTPSTCASGTNTVATATSDVNAPFSGTLSRNASCSTGFNQDYVKLTWTGTALPAYITPSNVTAIYGGFISNATGFPTGSTGAKDVEVNGTGVTPINGANLWPQGTYSAEIASGSGAQTFDYSTVSWVAEDSSSSNYCYSPFGDPCPSASTWTPVLFVYYTGTAPPPPNSVEVLPPLSLVDGGLGVVSPVDGGVDTGSANAYVASLPGYTVQVAGLSVCFLPAHSSTSGTPTLNVNSWGAWTIVKQGGTALASGDLTATAVACVRLDGQAWELQNPQTGYSNGTAAASNCNQGGTLTGVAGCLVWNVGGTPHYVPYF